MQYLGEFIAIGAVGLLGAMSPGPDFFMVMRNSLKYSRKVGVFTAIGIAFGLTIHIAYSLLGIGYIISKSILFYSIIKYLGAAYLIYIGYKSLRVKPYSLGTKVKKSSKSISLLSAFKIGFLTNVLNAKATIFFLSVFTQVIDPVTPLIIQAIYGIEIAVMALLWFLVISFIFSHKILKQKVLAIQHYIERVMGAVLFYLGIKVATSND